MIALASFGTITLGVLERTVVHEEGFFFWIIFLFACTPLSLFGLFCYLAALGELWQLDQADHPSESP